MGSADVERWFTHHAPSAMQIGAYQRIRDMAKTLAFVIEMEVPAGDDRDAAIRKLRECVMTANAGIACEGQ